MKRRQTVGQVRWDLALRYKLIETVAWWEGRLTTGHLMQSFGISRQQASKDINTYITEHAPKNLEYDKQLKGYVPSNQFIPTFIEDSASAYLQLLYQNGERAPHIDGLALAYAHTKVLDVPDRTIRPEVLRPCSRPAVKACAWKSNTFLSTRRTSKYASSPRTRWYTQACAGMCGRTVKRTVSTETSYSAVCAVSRACWMSRPTPGHKTKTGMPKFR